MQKTNKMEFLYPLRISFINLNSHLAERLKAEHT